MKTILSKINFLLFFSSLLAPSQLFATAETMVVFKRDYQVPTRSNLGSGLIAENDRYCSLAQTAALKLSKVFKIVWQNEPKKLNCTQSDDKVSIEGTFYQAKKVAKPTTILHADNVALTLAEKDFLELFARDFLGSIILDLNSKELEFSSEKVRETTSFFETCRGRGVYLYDLYLGTDNKCCIQ